jgi:hypothetical protein
MTEPAPDVAVPSPAPEPPADKDGAVAQKSAQDPNRTAIIGVVAALAGTVLGGVFGIITTNAQIKGAADTAQSQFLNVQRQTAYAQLVTAHKDFERAEDDIFAALGGYGRSRPPDDKALVPLQKILSDVSAKVAQAEGPVVLVGSPDTSAYAVAISEADKQTREDAESVISAIPTTVSDADYFAAKEKYVSSHNSSTNSSTLTDFLISARKDLAN